MMLNPFWSRHARDEARLANARPADLPPVPAETPGEWEEAGSEVRTAGEAVTGGGVQQGRQGRERSRSDGRRRMHRTLPDSWEQPDSNPVQSEGVMQFDEEINRGKRSSGLGAGDLEREIEKSMFEQVRRENEELKKELEKLKSVKSEGASSWCEVGTSQLELTPPPPPPKRVDSEKNGVRCTPNGTRVPLGSPPAEEVPVWPFEVDFQDYEHVENGDRWMRIGPTPPVIGGGRSPRELEENLWSPYVHQLGKKTEWMEKELLDMKIALEAERRHARRRGALMSGYWDVPFRPMGSNYVQECGHRPLSRVLGEVRDQDRAFGSGGCEDHRGDQECGGPGSFGGDRASADPGNPEVLRGDRALAGSGIPELCHGDRAVAGSGIPELCHGDRAVAESGTSGLCHGDRAGSTEVSHHGIREVRQQPHGRAQGDLKEEDQLKSIPITLPTLGPPEGNRSSIEAGDWLAQLKPYIADVTAGASPWWDRAVDLVNQRYSQWLGSSALERLKVDPPTSAEIADGRVRLEQRITTLLLSAVPQVIKSDLVANRQLHVGGLLFAIYKRYQPGGRGEREATLQALTSTSAAKSATEAVQKLREWKRRILRARELGASLPDPTIQVRALEVIMGGLLLGETQASFRVSSFRMAVQLDNNPNQEATLQFFDMLLSEAEQLQYGGVEGGGKPDSGEAAPTPKVKSLKPGERPAVASGQRCNHWGSEQGCRFTRNCRFEHPQLQDSANRCWLRSSSQHRKHECPYRYGSQLLEVTTGGSEKGSEKGKGKGKDGKGKGKNHNKGPSENRGKSGGGSAPGNSQGGNASSSTTDRTNGNGGDGEAPAVKAATVEEMNKGGEATDGLLTEVTSLLKSLRVQQPQLRVCNICKIGGGESHSMLLDGGATHCLRKAKNQREWDKGIPVEVQLASGCMKMKINPISKTLIVEEDGVQPIIPVNKLTALGYEINWTKSGCLVSHAVKGDLKIVMEQGCPTVQRSTGEELMKEIEILEEERAALRAVFLGGRVAESDEEKAIVKLKEMFPEVPLELLEKVPGKRNWSGHDLPFNRRRRRQIDQAKTVIVHLFAGKADPVWQQQEKDGVVVICLDVLGGCDLLHNNSLAGWIEELAESGRVRLWLSGPPCRTVSALRNNEDGGPPQLRGRYDGRFGLPELSTHHQGQVDGDSILWLRSLWWMTLSKESGGKSEYLVEQPLDPAEWVPVQKQPKTGCPSFMSWKESREVFQKLGLQVIRIEQGALGHLTPKPTMLATDVSELMALDGLKADSYDPVAWEMPLEDRIKKSKELAAWAPGLKTILCKVIQRIHKGGPVVKTLTVRERQEVQAWQDHHRAGHLPHRKDCPTCLLAAGRDRQHRRQACPVSHTLSLDIVGPFCSGTDQSGGAFKYGLVGVYTVPIDGTGSPLPEGLSQLQGRSNQDQDLDEEARDQDVGDAQGMGEVDIPGLQEAEEQEDVDEAIIQQQEVLEKKWKEFIQERRAMRVCNLTFGVPIKSREAGEVLTGVAKIFAKARAMQLPITRVHTDRAREFSGGKFQKWAQDRDLFHTMCSGDSPQENARAEKEVGIVKAQMRKLLVAARAPIQFWPLAFRQSVEYRQRCQLDRMGIRLPQLLPFGATAMVRRKEWHHRADPFRWPMMKVRLWGPAGDMAASAQGYFVQGEDGKFFRSTVVMVPSKIAMEANLQEGPQQEKDEVAGGDSREIGNQPGNLPGGEEMAIKDQVEKTTNQRGEEMEKVTVDTEEDIDIFDEEKDEHKEEKSGDQGTKKGFQDLVEIAKKAQKLGKGLEGLAEMDCGVDLNEVKGRECLVLQEKDTRERQRQE